LFAAPAIKRAALWALPSQLDTPIKGAFDGAVKGVWATTVGGTARHIAMTARSNRDKCAGFSAAIGASKSRAASGALEFIAVV
jgi:hypothetical protein